MENLAQCDVQAEVGSIMEIKELYELGKLVTFQPNLKLPVYNWFHFKEGFSRDFAMWVFREFKLKEGDWVLDPFCGVGTTLLSTMERGINSVGIDAHPVLTFVSMVKTRRYDLESLRSASRSVFSGKFEKPSLGEVKPILRKAFSRYALEDIAFFKGRINEIDNPLERDFFIFSLMVSAMRVSYAVKDGAVIRFFRRKHPPLRRVFKGTVKRFIRHLKKFKSKPCEIIVRHGDSRRLNFLDEASFDAIITSPPYLNKTEYVKAFAVEEALLGERIYNRTDEVFIGLKSEGAENPFPELKLPDVAVKYFSDMNLCLKSMYRVLRSCGKVALVVGQGVFPSGIIEADVLLAKLAERVGFNVKKRLIVNKRTATRDRTIKIGEALESVLIMEKP